MTDIRCPNCGQMVNRKCWNCRWERYAMTDALEIARRIPESGPFVYDIETCRTLATALIEAIKERDEARKWANTVETELEFPTLQAENERLREALEKAYTGISDCNGIARHSNHLNQPKRMSDGLRSIASYSKQVGEEVGQALSPQPSQESERVPCGCPVVRCMAGETVLHASDCPTQSQEGGAG